MLSFLQCHSPGIIFSIVYKVIVFYNEARAICALSFGLLRWLSGQRQHCWDIADRDSLQSWAPKFIDLGAPYRNSLRITVIYDCGRNIKNYSNITCSSTKKKRMIFQSLVGVAQKLGLPCSFEIQNWSGLDRLHETLQNYLFFEDLQMILVTFWNYWWFLIYKKAT